MGEESHELKYVILDINGVEHAVIFSKELVHKHVAESLQRGLRVPMKANDRDGTFASIWPVAAGFTRRDGGGVWRTRGESESLNIKSRTGDSDVLNRGHRIASDAETHMDNRSAMVLGDSVSSYRDLPRCKETKGSRLRRSAPKGRL